MMPGNNTPDGYNRLDLERRTKNVGMDTDLYLRLQMAAIHSEMHCRALLKKIVEEALLAIEVDMRSKQLEQREKLINNFLET